MRALVPTVLAALISTAFLAHATPRQLPAPQRQVVPITSAKAKVLGSKYAGEGVIIEDADIRYRYNADGTGTMVKHLKVKVQDEAGAKAFSVLSIAYASATQTAKMVSVKVTHPDGKTVVTPASDDIDQPALVTQEAPLYSDLKVVQVPVRGLQPGDTLEYTMRIDTTKAQVPGEFWDATTFLKTLVVMKETVALDVPADKYVQVWDPGLKPEVKDANGRKVYTWNYQQMQPTHELEKKEKAIVTATKPSIAWTTFKSWQQLGAWYRSLAAPRMAPTPSIVAKANEITAKAKTREAQARAIYDFVATQIRYIGVDFGIGRYQPHAAATVLANQYGDCKDKDTLLEALLRAKGFKTAPALIGAGIKMIPDLPSPGVFNHVITTVTINGKQMWLDSTPEVLPFRMLVQVLRHKQTLVIPPDGPAELERTPAQPPFPLVNRMDATATLTKDGDLKAHMVIVDQSDSELLLREVARNVAPAQWDRAVQYLSRLMGFGGTVSHAEFEHVEDLNDPIRLSYDYDHPKFGDWSELQILPLFPTLSVPSAPDKKPEKAIKLGAERTEIAKTVIHLPAQFTPDLPDAVHVKTAFATYDRTYSFEDGALKADRKVVILESKVPAKDWKAYKKFVKDCSLFHYTYIQLLTQGTGKGSGSGKTSAAASGAKSGAGSNATAAQLVAEANGLERSGDFEGVLKLLNKAKAIAPRQPFLWSNYGWVAMMEHDLPMAEKDLKRELKYHPGERYVSLLYAAALTARGESRKAIAVLTPVVAKHPDDSRAALMLASLQSKDDLPGAIATLQKALAAKPEEKDIPAALATYLIRNHEGDKAAPLLEKALASATDQRVLNNDSYELALTGKDLPRAEKKSREAVSKLEAMTAQDQVAGANELAFARSAALPENWDTLGYILMKEGKLDEARNYLEAAWDNQQSPGVGLHYGMVLEKLGERTQAMRVYELSLGGETADARGKRAYERATGKKLETGLPETGRQENERQLTAAIARLEREHVSWSGEDPEMALQDMRTFHVLVTRAPKKFEQATFRLQFAAKGPPQVMKVNGNAGMAQFVEKIQEVHFPEIVPKGSKAQLVRDAAMSCSQGDRHCVLVLMPLGGMQAENTSIQ